MGNYDFSIDRTIRVEIPGPLLSKEMGLRLFSGRSLVFVNSDGRDTFYGPSVVESGPAAGLVDRDAFLQMLDRQDLSTIWVIAGEKGAYGGSTVGTGFGGWVRHTAVYHVDGDRFVQSQLHTERQRPSKSQLEIFFGKESVPAGMVTESTDPRF